jgi:hypothetical protein
MDTGLVGAATPVVPAKGSVGSGINSPLYGFFPRFDRYPPAAMPPMLPSAPSAAPHGAKDEAARLVAEVDAAEPAPVACPEYAVGFNMPAVDPSTFAAVFQFWYPC